MPGQESRTPEAQPVEAPKPARKPFRARFSEKRLAPDAAVRQGRVTQFAWLNLGGLEGAAAFLNNHDDALGGRPLDLAVASAEGLEAVERAITARSAG